MSDLGEVFRDTVNMMTGQSRVDHALAGKGLHREIPAYRSDNFIKTALTCAASAGALAVAAWQSTGIIGVSLAAAFAGATILTPAVRQACTSHTARQIESLVTRRPG